MSPSRSSQQSRISGSVRFSATSTHVTTNRQALNHDSNNHGGKVTVGPLLDNDAPYSSIGLQKLRSVSLQIITGWHGELNLVSDEFAACPNLQYGTGEHSSTARDMLESNILNRSVPNGRIVAIRLLVLDGSSQWAICDHVTFYGNTNLIETAELVLPAHKKLVCIPLHRGNRHLYLDFALFLQKALATAFARTVLSDVSWPVFCKICDKVHNHVCGHARLPDIESYCCAVDFLLAWHASI